MKRTAFPHPMLRIAIGMLAAVLVVYLLELPPLVQREATQDFQSYHFEKEAAYTLYLEQVTEGLTFSFIPNTVDVTMLTGDIVGPGLTAPQARLRQGARRGEARLAEPGDRNAGTSAAISPQPTIVNPDGKEVAFMAGP